MIILPTAKAEFIPQAIFSFNHALNKFQCRCDNCTIHQTDGCLSICKALSVVTLCVGATLHYSSSLAEWLSGIAILNPHLSRAGLEFPAISEG
jgi:hypothetical protein